MPPEEKRASHGRRSDDIEHCGVHDEHSEAISSMKTERKIIAGVALTFLALCAYIYNTNSNSISGDLKEIKAFMIAARDNDTELKGRINNLEWRMQVVEGGNGSPKPAK